MNEIISPDKISTLSGCHAGADEMRRAAEAAGKSELLDRLAKD